MHAGRVLLLSMLAAPIVIATPVLAPPASVATPASPASVDVTQFAPVVVTGVVPGPGLWKVSKGGHVLWVLGTLSPLPGHIRWASHEVAQALAGSKQLLLEPEVEVQLGDGFRDKRFLLPYRARMNPHGEMLHQEVDAPTYARWLALKKQYIGGDYRVEHWRPLYAAQDLYAKALQAKGLDAGGGVPSLVLVMARRDGVPATRVAYRVVVKRPGDALKAFRAAAPDGLECFKRTLDSIEHDLPVMTRRANAWATGDLATLRRLPDSHRLDVCDNAITGSGFARRLGLADVPAQLESVWLAAARKALADNASSFALLPMDELLSPSGYFAKLKAQGYTVEAPPGLDDPPATAASAAR